MSWGSRAIGVMGEGARVGAANGFVAGWADPGPGSRMRKGWCGSGGNLEAHLSEKRAEIVRDFWLLTSSTPISRRDIKGEALG
jgi:hypothetical protein